LMSDIEELNNSIKIMSSDKENLQAEILTLRNKLEMAMALSEENEAAAIEARQVSVLYLVFAPPITLNLIENGFACHASVDCRD